MKYTYLQVQEEAFSEECYLDTKPSAQSKLNHTAKKYLKHGSATVSCQNSRSTGTSKNLTENHGAEKQKLSRAVFRAKTLAHAEKEQESKGKDPASGKKWQESFARYAPGSRLWKTHQRSLFGDWEQFLETWPKWGWMRGGECWALKTPERHIKEIAFGSLPTIGTPTAKSEPRSEKWRGKTLNPEELARKEYWPTPTTAEVSKIPAQANYGQKGLNNHPRIRGYPKRQKMKKDTKGFDGGTKIRQKWPTPNTSDANGANLPHDIGRNYLRAEVLPEEIQKKNCTEAREHGQLNPSWVEWLMGWPIGWTALEQLETGRYRSVQQWHSEFSAKD
tara:strand:+ start:170 stop:1168 length:999 start_codon:yes stop_codon:yes gene_type:complete